MSQLAQSIQDGEIAFDTGGLVFGDHGEENTSVISAWRANSLRADAVACG